MYSKLIIFFDYNVTKIVTFNYIIPSSPSLENKNVKQGFSVKHMVIKLVHDSESCDWFLVIRLKQK